MRPFPRRPFWTDYPIEALGDNPRTMASMRPCKLLSYDQDKYVWIEVGGVRIEIKVGYVYLEPRSYGEGEVRPFRRDKKRLISQGIFTRYQLRSMRQRTRVFNRILPLLPETEYP